jgi:hypothetical protein
MSLLNVTILLPSKSSPVMFVNVLWQPRKLLTVVIHLVIACSTHFSCLLKNTSTHLPSLTRLSSLAPKIYFPCSYNYHREEEKKVLLVIIGFEPITFPVQMLLTSLSKTAQEL